MVRRRQSSAPPNKILRATSDKAGAQKNQKWIKGWLKKRRQCSWCQSLCYFGRMGYWRSISIWNRNCWRWSKHGFWCTSILQVMNHGKRHEKHWWKAVGERSRKWNNGMTKNNLLNRVKKTKYQKEPRFSTQHGQCKRKTMANYVEESTYKVLCKKRVSIQYIINECISCKWYNCSYCSDLTLHGN